MACADVARAETMAATANNLIIFVLPWLVSVIVMSCRGRHTLTQINSVADPDAFPQVGF
jgi:hypothetical protein